MTIPDFIIATTDYRKTLYSHSKYGTCRYCDCKSLKRIWTRRFLHVGESKPVTRRRYECEDNKHRWTTVELLLDKTEKVVVKKDGTKEPYDESKFVKSLKMAIAKRIVALDRLKRIGEDLTSLIDVRARGAVYEVESSDIYQFGLKSLLSFDHISYLRYKSVGDQYKFLDDFKVDIDKLQN